MTDPIHLQYGIDSVKKIVTLLLVLCSVSAFAKTAYVTDELKITLRSGESSTHRIIRMLPTGERLTVLSSDSGNGYSKVRTASGAEDRKSTSLNSSHE